MVLAASSDHPTTLSWDGRGMVFLCYSPLYISGTSNLNLNPIIYAYMTRTRLGATVLKVLWRKVEGVQFLFFCSLERIGYCCFSPISTSYWNCRSQSLLFSSGSRKKLNQTKWLSWKLYERSVIVYKETAITIIYNSS